MRNKFSQFGLIVVGVLIGVAISLNYSAVAQRDGGSVAPADRGAARVHRGFRPREK